jgi:hypothetical integral membrane protein (TIGR02206 family)
MKYDVIIHSDEPRYWAMLLGTLLGGLLLIKAMDRLGESARSRFLPKLGWILVGLNLVLPLYAIIHPDQQFLAHRSLPVHFCGMNFLLIALNCFWRNTWVFTFSAFLGTIGGVHSFITPQLTVGDAPLVIVDYCLRHGIIIFMPIVMFRHFGMRFPKMGWLKTYAFAAVASTAVGCINWLLNTYLPVPADQAANYMYMWEPPKVSNPLVRPELGWPGYLAPLHLALIVHLVAIHGIYRWAEGRIVREVVENAA